MGTRSLTRFIDEGVEFVCMYRQYDGYPEGHGADLARILGPVKIVNGFGSHDPGVVLANGMGCLAAQVVAALKDGVGNIYLHAPGTQDCGEEYVYEITDKAGVPNIRVSDRIGWRPYELAEMFSGTPEQFTAWLKERE